MAASESLPGLDGGGVLDEAFVPEVNSTVLRQANTNRLNEAGSFTYAEEQTYTEMSRAGISADNQSIEQTTTAKFNLESEQSLIEHSQGDFSWDEYGTSTEKYERIEDSSEDPQYQVPDRDIGPDQYLDSTILGELETMETEHRVTEAGHVYTASGVDAVSDGFLNADVGSFREFEFKAVVSDQGVLKEFSYQIVGEDDDMIFRYTRSGEVTDIGSTEVREPEWLDDARAETN